MHLSEAQFACNNRQFPHRIRLLLQAYPIKSWHCRLTISSSPTTISTASTPGRTTCQHRTMCLSCHVSSVCCSCRCHCLSPASPSFLPLLNATAVAPPGHLPVVIVTCQPATHAGHLPGHRLLNATCFLDHAITAAIAVTTCPAAPTFHGCILNTSAYQKVSTIALNVSFSLPLKNFANSATTPGATQSHVCAFYNIACVLLMLVARSTVSTWWPTAP